MGECCKAKTNTKQTAAATPLPHDLHSSAPPLQPPLPVAVAVSCGLPARSAWACLPARRHVLLHRAHCGELRMYCFVIVACTAITSTQIVLPEAHPIPFAASPRHHPSPYPTPPKRAHASTLPAQAIPPWPHVTLQPLPLPSRAGARHPGGEWRDGLASPLHTTPTHRWPTATTSQCWWRVSGTDRSEASKRSQQASQPASHAAQPSPA